LKQQNEPAPKKPQAPKHWVLWTLVVLFIVGSITAMMLADYFFAPGADGTVSQPKDAADK
jgi:hypothetical protein